MRFMQINITHVSQKRTHQIVATALHVFMFKQESVSLTRFRILQK